MPRDVTFDNSQTFAEHRSENAKAKWLLLEKLQKRDIVLVIVNLALFGCAFFPRDDDVYNIESRKLASNIMDYNGSNL